MAIETARRKQFLFVDDDAGFLGDIKKIFSEMAHGTWEIFTAKNHTQALAQLRQQRMDVVVLDLNMPVMDGLQFLRLIGRTHPGQQVVILTGRITDQQRQACLESGAALVLEKLVGPDGFSAIFATLDALAGAAPQEGFRGMMRRVGLLEVLQMECLSKKSSVLEVFAGTARGRIFISEGSIVHADSGTLQGEGALYSLLALQGGEFNFRAFVEPPCRTITGHWEQLLMDAARLSDEGGQVSGNPEDGESAATAREELAVQRPETEAPGAAGTQVRIEEVVLCSGSGEVLHEWECKSLERRLKLLEELEQQGAQLSKLGPIGRFDRLEILTAEERMVCEVQPNRRLFVRSRAVGTGLA